MPNSIFVLNGESHPVAVNQAAFDLESDLQTLIAQYPELLPGHLINPDEPRRWLLVKREMGIPDQEDAADRWRIDHLFLDQEGIPTLIEVKMERDQRGRREVVAQMLDYAANAVLRWNVERLRAALEKTCSEREEFADEVVTAFVGPQTSVEAFWGSVKTNLEAQRIRLIFLSDRIHPELRTIVEFLNRQMDPVEVLAIELQYFADNLRTVRTLVPTLYGQISVSKPGRSTVAETSLSKDDFLQVISEANSQNRLVFVKSLIAWAERNKFAQIFRTGPRGAVFIPVCKAGEQITYPISCKQNGKLVFQLRYFQQYDQFQKEDALLELESILKKIPGFEPRGGMKGLPCVNMDLLATQQDHAAVFAAIDWILNKRSEPGL